MATVTRGLDASPDVHFQWDYDDVSLKLLTFRCVNNDPQGRYADGWVQQLTPGGVPTGPRYSGHFGPGTTSVAVPQQGANSITLVLDARGRIANLDGQFTFPVPA